MKKFSKITIYLFVCIVFTFVGCKNSILNQEPQNKYVSSDVWGDINLARDYLHTVYNGIGQWGIKSTNGPREMPSSTSDEAMQRGNHGIWVFNKGNITASNYGTFNIWKTAYSLIRKCNIFLQNIDKVPNVSEEEVKSMKAEVRYIRASKYEYLVDWYSWWNGDHNGVPIIKKPFNLDDKFNKKRASYSEVVNFIVSELDDVAKVLPLKRDAANKGKVTKGAALALKSEILLYAASKLHNPNMDQSKWKKAADAAKAVIDLGIYSLDPVETWKDYSQIFLKQSDNPEIILARFTDPDLAPSKWLGKMNSPNGYDGWSGNCPTQTLVDKFEMDNGKKITDPTSGYDAQNPYIDRELRFYANIVYNGRMYRGRKTQMWVPGGLDSKDGPSGHNTSPTGYNLYKFMDESNDFVTSNPTTPYIIFRLAEIYLNYAEAEYHLGNEDVARKYVNKIRRRAKLPDIQSSGTQLLEDIKHERTIELAFEKDHRWNDIRRWKILDKTFKDYIGIKIVKNSDGSLTYSPKVAMKRNYHKYLYSLPIPLTEIQRTGLTQNPGY